MEYLISCQLYFVFINKKLTSVFRFGKGGLIPGEDAHSRLHVSHPGTSNKNPSNHAR